MLFFIYYIMHTIYILTYFETIILRIISPDLNKFMAFYFYKHCNINFSVLGCPQKMIMMDIFISIITQHIIKVVKSINIILNTLYCTYYLCIFYILIFYYFKNCHFQE
ncbi:hypothetical protein BJ944DRAFT_273258 [Cunninghamella echinulata]|nr:hypothetical protein BJ944DRAFT_273258 [Cunninghamella echinulata]